MNTTALQAAISIAGSQTKLAAAIGVRQQHIWAWLNRDGKVPVEYVAPICRATKGVIRPVELRPDLQDVFQMMADEAQESHA